MSNETLQPISEQAKDDFLNLGLDKFGNVALCSSILNGVPCDVIVAGDIFGNVQPLAIFVNEGIYPMLHNPNVDGGDDYDTDKAIVDGTLAFYKMMR